MQALCAKTLSASPPAATAVRYRSLRHCFELTLRQEGARAFFLSLPTTLMMNIPFHAMHFSVYEFMRQQLLPVMVGEQELERTGAARGRARECDDGALTVHFLYLQCAQTS